MCARSTALAHDLDFAFCFRSFVLFGVDTTFQRVELCIASARTTLAVSAVARGESKPERRSGKRIIAGTAFRLEFLVGWYYDADATMAVPELY